MVRKRIFPSTLVKRIADHDVHLLAARSGSAIVTSRAVLTLIVTACLLVGSLPLVAGPQFTGPTPEANAPLADPVVTADATFSANKATAWQQDDIQLLLLEGDVVFRVGTYGFRGQRVVVRIDTEIRYRRKIRHLAIYFDEARMLHGAGRVHAEGPGLLVTASTTGKLLMDAALLSHVETAPQDALVAAAAQRIAEHRERLAAAGDGSGDSGDSGGSGGVETAPTQPLFTPELLKLRQTRRQQIAEEQLEYQVALLPRRTDQKPKVKETPIPGVVDETILPTKGAIKFTADRLWADAQRNAMALIGDVTVSYTDYETGRIMTLTAENVVIFSEGDVQNTIAGREVEAARVTGIYLEDNVIVTDGPYTVRAPRVYFDVKRNQAILLEAVMYTWDVKKKIPLYVRAEVVRQHSRTSFEADEALLTTSEFGRPHVAIGAARITVQQPPENAPKGTPSRFTAKHTTLRVNDLPVAYWPYMAGENNDIPIRRVSANYSENKGVVLETTWNLFALAGKDAPNGVDADLLLDSQGDHGPAVGLMVDYTRPHFFGEFESYLLPADNGDDDLGGRSIIEQDNETRGFIHWQHRQYLDDDWELSLEFSSLSDETFLEEFFENESDEARTYETSLYLEKRMDDSVLSLLAKYDLNDFTPQLSTLQAPGYTVDKFPELRYRKTGTSLFGDRATWFSDNRVSRMRIRVGEDTPLDRGFRVATSPIVFGMPRTTSFKDAADAMGVPSNWVNRFDSRQELSMPFKSGPINVTPYAIGRVTAYDDDFSAFAPAEDDQYRFWAMVGARLSTEIHRTLSDTESVLLDIHRLRHIIRPSVDIWAGGSTIDEGDLPVYDRDVEAIQAAPGVRFGLRNTLQTQRGGPGRWRSVDWIVLDTDLVLRADDSDVDAELARYFNYRPELTTGGDHFYTRLLWMVTDTLAMTGELTQNLEDNRTAQWRTGITMQHTPRLSTYVDYQELDLLDSQLLTYGFNYQLTTKYSVGFNQRLDLADSTTREINLNIERKMPRWRFLIVASVDDIDDETTLGFILIPEGLTSKPRPLRIFDSSNASSR